MDVLTAKKTLEDFLECKDEMDRCDYICNKCSLDHDAEEVFKAMKVCAESVENQIAKKAIIGEAGGMFFWKCPTCGRRKNGFRTYELSNYCEVCGQKIGFEIEEE